MNTIEDFADRNRKCPVCNSKIDFPESLEIKRDRLNKKLFHASAVFLCKKCNIRFSEKEDLTEERMY